MPAKKREFTVTVTYVGGTTEQFTDPTVAQMIWNEMTRYKLGQSLEKGFEYTKTVVTPDDDGEGPHTQTTTVTREMIMYEQVAKVSRSEIKETEVETTGCTDLEIC